MRIIISSSVEVKDEAKAINRLISSDIHKFHLRKPSYNLADFLQILLQIQPQFLKKVVIHSHFDLIKKYNLGGIHLPEKDRNALSNIELKALKKSLNQKGISLSTSFHSLEDAENEGELYSYYFLSPVFDSISKTDYTANSALLYLPETIIKSKKAFALGGITEENYNEILQLGFAGGAMLGSIWK